ncbi:Phosphoribosyl transferase domain protein [Candidatus Venteria ishoeyi]|uniref:Phosphoribosyl transferase domain protein n=1 Tax=Candidatus Venteria ishoeyi TaxID=1899563 RepID=A0A1H6FEW1_9GAMM|nr:Phosphoribosyl transferase domain protein [Candidatus Venteria ishoeyi]
MLFFQPVKDIDLELLKSYSKKLAQNIDNSGFKPDHVLFVERAGLLIGYFVADYFNCPISGISTRRVGSSAKSRMKIVLRYLPRFITHFLRQLELNSSIHKIKNERHIITDYPLPSKELNIILIDDAIDTGYSVKAVVNYLLMKGYMRDKIKVAVITTTTIKPKFKADFSLFKEVICAFPWSYDSRQYKETWLMYEKKRKLLCKIAR